jgi:ubiquinone biosynthesis protein UbiJ
VITMNPVSQSERWGFVGSKTSSRMRGPRGMEQNTQGKKEEIDKEFIENLLKSYSERLAKAHEEIERLKHENAILKERIAMLADKKRS